MLLSRRSFFRGAAAVLAAPAIVRVAAIMPVRADSALYGDFEFSGFSSEMPQYMLMSTADWRMLFGATPPWLTKAMTEMANPT